MWVQCVGTGGLNDRCVTGMHVLGSHGFAFENETILNVTSPCTGVHTHTLQCASLARANPVRGLANGGEEELARSNAAQRPCCVQHVYIFNKKASKNHKRSHRNLVGSPPTAPNWSLHKHLKTHTGHMLL